MDVFKENKLSQWKHILNKLRKTKNVDDQRLETIRTNLDQGQIPYNKDIHYLEDKYNQLKQSTDIQNDQVKKEKKNTNYNQELEIIDKLLQKEIGDFSRLQSIKNYLVDDQPLLNEDKIYLKEQNSELKKMIGIDDLRSSPKAMKRTVPLKPQAILIDDVEVLPTHDYSSLSKTISKLIQDSNPHFTIGIYGEWGTGKTTLMKSIESDLVGDEVENREQKILPIWFNAWKYEREENLASISLLKTVGYCMEGHEKFDELAKTIFKGLTIVGKDLMQNIARQVVSKNESSDDEIDKKMNYLNKLYRDSIYYDGLDKIKHQMDVIRLEDQDLRVVIFIDDLDRCSPNKALEVLESIKLFLDMEGFIFVIGLSYKTVTQLITRAYEQTGIKGEDYIKKIIQIPIKIPSWSNESIIDLIDNCIVPRLNSDYTKFLRENSGMIARVVNYNPRQLKRFINNVIIAFETFASKKGSPEIQFNEIFLAKILKAEWPEFYRQFVNNKEFREIVKWMITKPKDLRKYFKYINTLTDEFPAERKQKRYSLLEKLQEYTNGQIDSPLIEILSDFDNETWIFFDNVQSVLNRIEDWKVIDNVMDVVEEFQYNIPIGSSKAKKIKESQISQQPQQQL